MESTVVNNPNNPHLIAPVMSSSKIEIWHKLQHMACILWTRTRELTIKKNLYVTLPEISKFSNISTHSTIICTYI